MSAKHIENTIYFIITLYLLMYIKCVCVVAEVRNQHLNYWQEYNVDEYFQDRRAIQYLLCYQGLKKMKPV